jgi:hypothetical protein
MCHSIVFVRKGLRNTEEPRRGAIKPAASFHRHRARGATKFGQNVVFLRKGLRNTAGETRKGGTGVPPRSRAIGVCLRTSTAPKIPKPDKGVHGSGKHTGAGSTPPIGGGDAQTRRRPLAHRKNMRFEVRARTIGSDTQASTHASQRGDKTISWQHQKRKRGRASSPRPIGGWGGRRDPKGHQERKSPSRRHGTSSPTPIGGWVGRRVSKLWRRQLHWHDHGCRRKCHLRRRRERRKGATDSTKKASTVTPEEARAERLEARAKPKASLPARLAVVTRPQGGDRD